jgi:hypothetical protein
VGPQFAIFCILLALDGHHPVEVSWNAGVPLWTALSPAGKVVDAGPFADWAGPPVAARIGALVEPARAAPEPLPRPRELPEALDLVVGPMLPPGVPLTQLTITPPTQPGLTPRPESASPPIAVQATQRRVIRTASESKPAVPGQIATPDAVPSARLVLPKRITD